MFRTAQPTAILAPTAILLLAATAAAQPPTGGESPPAAAGVAAEMQSPKAALRSFLSRMANDKKQAAAELLDLSGFTSEAAAAKGPELAFKLYDLMPWALDWQPGREWPPLDDGDLLLAPDDPAAASPWKLSILVPYPNAAAGEIEIDRAADGRWQFSAATVAQIEELFLEAESASVEKLRAEQEAELGAPAQQPVAVEEKAGAESRTTEPLSVRIGRLFPPILRQTRFLLPDYQWICLLLIAIVSRLLERGSRALLTRLGDAAFRRVDEEFQASTGPVWKPVGRLVYAATWYGAALAIGLPVAVVSLLLIVLRLATVFTAVAAAFAVTNLVADYFLRRARRTQRRYDDLVVPLAATTFKVLVCLAAVIASVAAFDKQLPVSLLGGLGIGGVALALASQETLSNFFGSLTVLFDRPFEVGDWVVVDGIEGEIESVGFRSTRIRTGLNSQVTLPNSKLAGAAIDNLGRRKFRRYLTRLGLEYGTDPERIEAFCEGVRELIRRHPHTRKDFYACYFNEFGASSLEVLLVVYFVAPDWATELRERHRLLADIARLAKRLEVEFAFPTQTVHLYRGEPAEAPEPPEQPDRAGQRLAAEIAGELPNYQDRPGRVKFPGPTPLDPPIG